MASSALGSWDTFVNRIKYYPLRGCRLGGLECGGATDSRPTAPQILSTSQCWLCVVKEQCTALQACIKEGPDFILKAQGGLPGKLAPELGPNVEEQC